MDLRCQDEDAVACGGSLTCRYHGVICVICVCVGRGPSGRVTVPRVPSAGSEIGRGT